MNSDVDMNSASGIYNLTATADRLRMGERAGTPDRFRRDGMSAEILTPEKGLTLGQELAGRDIFYIVVAGYGTLACGDEEVDFTTGDVLFVPVGTNHHFAKLSQKVKTWKIQLPTK